MVIPLLGVKTRCADKSTAEHYERTYICSRNGFTCIDFCVAFLVLFSIVKIVNCLK